MEKKNVYIIQFPQKKLLYFTNCGNVWRSNKIFAKKAGRRYSSALTEMNLSNKVINKVGKRY